MKRRTFSEHVPALLNPFELMLPQVAAVAPFLPDDRLVGIVREVRLLARTLEALAQTRGLSVPEDEA